MEIIIIITGLFIDRITKIWAASSLLMNGEIEIIKGFLSLFYLENKGAAFGIFQNKAEVLAAVTIIILVGMIYYLIKHRTSSIFLKIGISLIVSGAFGNFYDRLKYNYVIDFISLHYYDIWYFPVFNFADMMVVAGTAIVVIYLVKEEF